MQSPKYQDIRVLSFPTPDETSKSESESKSESQNLKKYPVALVSISLGLLLGLTAGASAVWINPEQTSLRELSQQAIKAESSLNQIKQCIEGI